MFKHNCNENIINEAQRLGEMWSLLMKCVFKSQMAVLMLLLSREHKLKNTTYLKTPHVTQRR